MLLGIKIVFSLLRWMLAKIDCILRQMAAYNAKSKSMLKGSCRSCSDKLFQGCCIAVLRVACVHKVCIVRCKMRSERKYKNHHP